MHFWKISYVCSIPDPKWYLEDIWSFIIICFMHLQTFQQRHNFLLHLQRTSYTLQRSYLHLITNFNVSAGKRSSHDIHKQYSFSPSVFLPLGNHFDQWTERSSSRLDKDREEIQKKKKTYIVSKIPHLSVQTIALGDFNQCHQFVECLACHDKTLEQCRSYKVTLAALSTKWISSRSEECVVHIRKVKFWKDGSYQVVQGCYFTERSCLQLYILWQTQSPLRLFQMFFSVIEFGSLQNFAVWLLNWEIMWRVKLCWSTITWKKKYGNKWARIINWV